MTGAALSIERDQRIDFFRGLALLIIFIDHIQPNFLASYTLQRFAFFDAADVFVFISGYVIGQVYTRELRRGGFAGCFAKAVRRCGQLYKWHLGIAASTMLLLYCFSWKGLYLNSPSLYLFLRAPYRTCLMIVTLRHTPSYLGILPLYLFLTALTPFAVYFVDKGNRFFFAGSIASYLLVQWLRGSDATPHYEGLMQYFNVFAWQFIFVIGIWLGNRQLRGERLEFLSTTRFTLLAWVMTISSIFVRLAMTSHHMAAVLHTNFWLNLQPRIVPLTNKITGGPLRLLNFFVVLILICRISRYSNVWTGWLAKSLVPCGRHSLAVFGAGVLLAYSATLLASTSPGDPWIETYASLTGCTVLLIIAHLAAERTAGKRGRQTAWHFFKTHRENHSRLGALAVSACASKSGASSARAE